MTTLLARVLLTLAFVTIASAETCTLCPNGEKPRNGNAIVFEDGTDLVTCKEFAKEIIANSDDDDTCDDNFDHAIQVVCGCPKVKAGSCPGICKTGFILAEPNLPTDEFEGLTCSVVDQLFRGKPGETICETDLARNNIEVVCKCKEKVKPGQNMGGGAGNAGTGMNGMAGGRKLRFGGLEEHFPPRAARGLAM
jgi:hypothetical protein